MITEKELREIVAESVRAPSGHNFQPWKFEIGEESMRIFLDAQADQTILNYKQWGSYLSIGALIENIETVATGKGFIAETEVTAAESESCVAVVRVTRAEPGAPRAAERYAAVHTRATNRMPYKKREFSDTDASEFLAATQNLSSVRLTFVSDSSKIARAAAAMSLSDWLLFNARTLHGFVFNHIRWTSAEEQKKRDGLYLATLELPPPVRVLFRLFRYWPAARALGVIGFGSVVAKQNAALYEAVGALGCICVPSFSRRNLVMAGRALERVWLLATQKGLSMQPIMGTLYLSAMAADGAALPGFSEKLTRRVVQAGARLRSEFPTDGQHMVCLFRIGKGESPSARSSRKDPDITKLSTVR